MKKKIIFEEVYSNNLIEIELNNIINKISICIYKYLAFIIYNKFNSIKNIK